MTPEQVQVGALIRYNVLMKGEYRTFRVTEVLNRYDHEVQFVGEWTDTGTISPDGTRTKGDGRPDNWWIGNSYTLGQTFELVREDQDELDYILSNL